MRRRPLPWLAPDAAPSTLPPVGEALADPPGLLAAGGALTPEWLRHAYRHGIFPWYSAGEPILWWSPPVRMVFRPDALRITRSLRQSARNRGYLIGFNNDFSAVVAACASRGKNISPLNQDTESTWIVPEMLAAYTDLHAAGDAHSVEVWKDGELVGGLYGVSLGGVFWGESMFSRSRDASKVALLALAAECRERGIGLIDAQFHTTHLESLGGFEMPRGTFVAEVAARTLQQADQAAVRPWRRPPESACKLA